MLVQISNKFGKYAFPHGLEPTTAQLGLLVILNFTHKHMIALRHVWYIALKMCTLTNMSLCNHRATYLSEIENYDRH